MTDAATERRSAKSTGRKVSDATISARADVDFLSPARQSRRIRATSDSERLIDRCHMLCYKQLLIDTGLPIGDSNGHAGLHLIST